MLSLVDASSSKHNEANNAKPQAADDIISVASVRAPRTADASAYTSFARIIHVPERDEGDERASADDRDQPDVGHDDDKPGKPFPPPTRRRDVLSVVPPRAEGP